MDNIDYGDIVLAFVITILVIVLALVINSAANAMHENNNIKQACIAAGYTDQVNLNDQRFCYRLNPPVLVPADLTK